MSVHILQNFRERYLDPATCGEECIALLPRGAYDGTKVRVISSGFDRTLARCRCRRRHHGCCAFDWHRRSRRSACCRCWSCYFGCCQCLVQSDCTCALSTTLNPDTLDNSCHK